MNKDEFLKSRRRELTELANDHAGGWQEKIKTLRHDDDGLIIAALATVLEIDVHNALNSRLSIADLKSSRNKNPRPLRPLEDLFLHRERQA